MTLRSWFPLEQEFRPWGPFHTAVALPICACFPTSDEDLWGGVGDDENHDEDNGCDRDDGGDGGGDRDDGDDHDEQPCSGLHLYQHNSDSLNLKRFWKQTREHINQ